VSPQRRRLVKGLAIAAGVVFLVWFVKLAIVISSGTLVGPVSSLPFGQGIVAQLAQQGDVFARWSEDAYQRHITVLGHCDAAAFDGFARKHGRHVYPEGADLVDALLPTAAEVGREVNPFATTDRWFIGACDDEELGLVDVRGAFRDDDHQFVLRIVQ
jgi:hypothetical protein